MISDGSELKFHGERVVPGDVPAALFYAHLARYRFALPFAKRRTVLDAGCGTGYGSAVLSTTADAVIGIDINQEAVKYASRHYGREVLQFSPMDCCRLGFAKGTFDLVCSFEVIEHVDDYAQCIHEFCRVLTTDGILIVSTPRRLTKSPENPYHNKEFTEEELRIALQYHFVNVAIYGQFSSPHLESLVASYYQAVNVLRKLDIFKFRRVIHRISTYSQRQSISRAISQATSGMQLDKIECTVDDFYFSSDNVSGSGTLVAVCKGKGG